MLLFYVLNVILLIGEQLSSFDITTTVVSLKKHKNRESSQSTLYQGAKNEYSRSVEGEGADF